MHKKEHNWKLSKLHGKVVIEADIEHRPVQESMFEYDQQMMQQRICPNVEVTYRHNVKLQLLSSRSADETAITVNLIEMSIMVAWMVYKAP